MGNLTDLKRIFETYTQGIVQDNDITDNFPIEPKIAVDTGVDSSCNVCGSCSTSPCSCSAKQEDSNVEMAKSEVFSILKLANDLMNRLQNMSSLEPWQLSKIVKANDYLNAVNNSVEYDEFEKCQKDLERGMSDINNGMVVVSQIKDMLAGEDINVNEKVLKNVIFNIECLKSK